MPDLTSLPNELLVHILSYLEYPDLRFSIPATNRHLKEIIDSAPVHRNLAEILFLDKVRSFTVDYCMTEREIRLMQKHDGKHSFRPGIFKLYPHIEHLKIRKAPLEVFREDFNVCVDDIGFMCPSGRFIPLLETPVAKENVTNPASNSVDLILHVKEVSGADWGFSYLQLSDRPTPTNNINMMELIDNYVQSVNQSFRKPKEIPRRLFITENKIFPGIRVTTMLGIHMEYRNPVQADPRILVFFKLAEHSSV